jgi:hypothetical protein
MTSVLLAKRFVSDAVQHLRFDYSTAPRGPKSPAHAIRGIEVVVERLNLNLLPVAFALCEERSVSGAAKALGMSQPAGSMALRKLRAQFNDPLLIRVRARRGAPAARAQVEMDLPDESII